MAYMQQYMAALDAYYENASSIAIDGAKIPHLPAGPKLNLHSMGTPGGVGTEFEDRKSVVQGKRVEPGGRCSMYAQVTRGRWPSGSASGCRPAPPRRLH